MCTLRSLCLYTRVPVSMGLSTRVSGALCAPVGTLRAVGGAVRVPVKALRVCVSGVVIGCQPA